MRNGLGGRLRATRNDSGIVAVWTALLLFVFMGMAALAVDTSRWYVEMARLQNAVDAGALAGAVYMPGNLDAATSTAQAVVTANGWDGTKARVEKGVRPSQLRVTLASTVNNPFGTVLGTGKTTITRTAVADYAAPVPMGSPCNVFGTEPTADKWASGNCPPTSGKFFANIAGPNTNKARGDAFATAYCTASESASASAPIDGCSGTRDVNKVDPSKPRNNNEYTTDGYIYIVRAKSAGTLQLQGYDLAYGSKDLSMGQPHQDATSETVRVTVRKPAKELGVPLSGDLACSPLTIAKNDVNYVDKWMPLCGNISVAAGEDYSIQIQTSLGQNPTGGGMNQYSLRASLGSAAKNLDVSIFAFERMAIYTNDRAAAPTFNFVRLDSSAAGRTLVVRLFDLGDATGSDKVTATMLQPDSNQAFADCTGTGTVSGTLSNCSVSLNEEENSGRWQQISIRIPADYVCPQETDQSKCWVKVKLDPKGGRVTDITTWTARLEGDPVRIIE